MKQKRIFNHHPFKVNKKKRKKERKKERKKDGALPQNESEP